MRLINTSDLSLHDFTSTRIPFQYAILSHTWTAAEVTLQEFISIPPPKNKLGYHKILDFCALCKQRGIEWAWCDTCCIDKTNSSELSEAINSMFNWYRRSSLCIVYLSDMLIPTTFHGKPESTIWEDQFRNSAWFSRGWTLQELIAPDTVEFFSAHWIQLGNKESLQKIIAGITGIDTSYITSPKNLGLACIAQRMSWASRRITTREEDRAYCLLGLFGVNMSLLYGEGGARAFVRLQEEILKVSADHSIFVWFANSDIFPEAEADHFKEYSSGLLAPSPDYFWASGYVRRRLQEFRVDRKFLQRSSPKPYQMTNRGLQIELPISKQNCEDAGGDEGSRHSCNCKLAVLDCYIQGMQPLSLALRIRPQKFNVYTDGDMWQFSDGDFERCHLDKRILIPQETVQGTKLDTLFVRRGSPWQLDSGENETLIPHRQRKLLRGGN
jgi:hypothetical protein